MRTVRAAVAVLAAALLAVTAATGLAPNADATTYRYWVYWHYTDGSWHYSQVGPGGYRVHDGDVEGWRFGRSAASSSAVTPRRSGDYASLCPSDPSSSSGTQAAVVVDYGTEADAPSYPTATYCVTLGSAHQGSNALRATGLALRTDGSGLVCGIRNYPKPPECGKTVNGPATTTKPTPRRTSTTTPPSQPSAAVPQGSGSQPASAAAAPSSSATPSQVVARPILTTLPSSLPSVSPSAEASVTQPGIGSEPKRGRGIPTGLLAGSALVAVLGGAAALRARR